MSDLVARLTPEQLAEGRRLAAEEEVSDSFWDWLGDHGDELLAAAERAEAAESLLRKAARVVEAVSALSRNGNSGNMWRAQDAYLALTPEDREQLKGWANDG